MLYYITPAKSVIGVFILAQIYFIGLFGNSLNKIYPMYSVFYSKNAPFGDLLKVFVWHFMMWLSGKICSCCL